jgi:hypothetical protein
LKPQFKIQNLKFKIACGSSFERSGEPAAALVFHKVAVGYRGMWNLAADRLKQKYSSQSSIV